MNNLQVHKSYVLTTEWQRLERDDKSRRGVLLQNQSVNSDGIMIATGETGDFAAIEILPSGNLYEDLLPPNGEIWAKSRAGTPSLTLVLKY